ncbi:MAG: glycoside hydrolase family 127 protein [Siphonobacter sp.]
MKRLLVGLLWVTSLVPSVAQSLVSDELNAAESAQVNGFVGERLDAAYQNRILVQDTKRLVEPFRHRDEATCWQSEFWGKWFTSAVLAYRYHPDPRLKAILDQTVSDLISTQTPDGYIGNYAEANHLQQWDIWGRKYCMLGLLAYYDLTKDRKSLQATQKLADHLILELQTKKALIVKQGNHRGMAASSVLEPISLLYARTKDKRYLDFAEEIVRQWETPDGPQLISKAGVDVAHRFPKPNNWFGWQQGQKAYEMMSCYEGLLELYRLTGKEVYKRAVEQTWDNIRTTEINVVGSGSSVECWFGGKHLQTQLINHYQETCVTATWIKLSQQLLRLTGNPKYADAIEQTYYNALLGSMKADGSDWTKYTPLAGQRLQGSEQCGMGLNCCVASGPRGLFTLPLTAVMQQKKGIVANFYLDGSFHLKTPAHAPFTLVEQTDYPRSGRISLKTILTRPETFAVSIRIPAWSKHTFVQVNGKTLEGVKSGEYLEISRTWQSGDEIKLELDMKGRIVKEGDNPAYLAIIRGPLVLTRDARLDGVNIDEALTPLLSPDSTMELKPVSIPSKDIWMAFEGMFKAESHKEGENKPIPLLLCDYASAGNTLDEHSWFRVWLPQLIDPRNN